MRSHGASGGVNVSHGESRGVKGSQGESGGVNISHCGLGELRVYHGGPLKTNRAKCLWVCEWVSESVNSSVLELPAQLKTGMFNIFNHISHFKNLIQLLGCLPKGRHDKNKRTLTHSCRKGKDWEEREMEQKNNAKGAKSILKMLYNYRKYQYWNEN